MTLRSEIETLWSAHAADTLTEAADVPETLSAFLDALEAGDVRAATAPPPGPPASRGDTVGQ